MTTLDLKSSAFDPKEKVWTKFPPEGSKHTPPHQSSDFRWKDYCPVVFRSDLERFTSTLVVCFWLYVRFHYITSVRLCLVLYKSGFSDMISAISVCGAQRARHSAHRIFYNLPDNISDLKFLWEAISLKAD